MAKPGGGPSGRAAKAPALASDKPLVDWQYLFAAVRDRLRSIAAAPDEPFDEQPQARVLRQMQSQVLECVGALDQLHGMLAGELRRTRQVEREAIKAKTELARTRKPLADPLNGTRLAQQPSRYDELTQLVNRRFFRERVDQSLAHAPAVALIYFDLDDFEPINDLHGPDVGDEVLRIVATRLRHSVREGDVVGRIGGDEFACLLANLPNREQLDQLAAKLRSVVGAPLTVGTLEFAIGVSMVIAICPSRGTSATTLSESVDAAMDRSKRRSLGHGFFDGAVSLHNGAMPAP